ncbi:MAG: SLBB domain-containing protein [Calditrichia bacterium]
MKYSVYMFLLMYLSCGFLFAQNKTQQGTRGRNIQTPQLDVDFQQLDKSSQQIIPQQQYLEQALGKAIDSTRYILGPGDQMLIKIWGPLENQFITEITPEGYLVIPTVADVKLAGLTLADGSEIVKQTLNKYFKNAEFSIRLIKMRKFRVYLVGEINSPGTYYLRSADRVSDAIELAGGLTQWGDDTRLQLRHNNLPTDTVNINKFYLYGDLEENPNLDGGDIIYIPPIDLAKNYVIVEGNVGSEGIYQFRESETLLSFLTRIRAINRRSDVNNVVLVRDGKRIYYDLIREESSVRNELLHTGDRIIVPTNRDRVYGKRRERCRAKRRYRGCPQAGQGSL